MCLVQVFASMQDLLLTEEDDTERMLHNIHDLATQLHQNVSQFTFASVFYLTKPLCWHGSVVDVGDHDDDIVTNMWYLLINCVVLYLPQ